jgi:PAS domain S-box-containing protein
MLRESGIEAVGKVPWGTHFCQFYQGSQDLIDVLVPYFKAGLHSNEFCMWVTSAPLEVAEAKASLEAAVPELDSLIKKGQIEILDYTEWYLRSGKFNSKEVLAGWVDKLEDARKKGFEGLRLTGNTHWLEDSTWNDFEQYEAAVNDVIGNHRMIALCSYALEKCGAKEIIDVVANHQFALIRRHGGWNLIESTHHKLTEDALRASEARFRSLFDSANEGIAVHEMIYDKSGKEIDYRILNVNDAYESILGISRKNAVGKLATKLYSTDKAPYLDIYAKVARTGKATSFEVFFEPMNQHFLISVFSPEVGKFATMFSDISHQKILEAQAEKRADDLFRSNSELQQFAYVASHDLQEPLRTIVNSLSLFERRNKGKLDPKDQTFIEMAVDGGQRMRKLIDDLLQYSRVETQGKPFETVRMDDVVKKTVELFKETIQELDAKVSWHDLPTVCADESQMLQLMQNLISNALKFHSTNKPDIRISYGEQGGEQLFRVEDNGIGLDMKYAEEIFQMFKRLHGSGDYPGTGIGLAVAKKIVERHGGRIWVESEEGKGATFFFTLPKN